MQAKLPFPSLAALYLSSAVDTSFSGISTMLSKFSTIASGSTGGSGILTLVAEYGEADKVHLKQFFLFHQKIHLPLQQFLNF